MALNGPVGAGEASDGEQYLIVALGGETFALPVSLVRDILDVGPVTAVPTAPRFVGALINVRGHVAPLADLCLRLGLEPSPRSIDTRVVVIQIEVEGVPALVGILADKVREVARLDAVVTEDIPRIGTRWRPEFAAKIGRRGGEFVAVLDVGKIFAPFAQRGLAG